MDHQALADIHADVVDDRRVGRVVGPEHQVAGRRSATRTWRPADHCWREVRGSDSPASA
jgi:hypothetical protein